MAMAGRIVEHLATVCGRRRYAQAASGGARKAAPLGVVVGGPTSPNPDYGMGQQRDSVVRLSSLSAFRTRFSPPVFSSNGPCFACGARSILRGFPVAATRSPGQLGSGTGP